MNSETQAFQKFHTAMRALERLAVSERGHVDLPQAIALVLIEFDRRLRQMQDNQDRILGGIEALKAQRGGVPRG